MSPVTHARHPIRQRLLRDLPRRKNRLIGLVRTTAIGRSCRVRDRPRRPKHRCGRVCAGKASHVRLIDIEQRLPFFFSDV